MNQHGHGDDEASLSEMLGQSLLRLLPTPPKQLDWDKPFREYGLDSMAAVGFAADLEDLLRIPVSATAFWDYPTLRELAAFLKTQLSPNDHQLLRSG